MDGWNDHDCVIPNPGDSRQYPVGYADLPTASTIFREFFVYELGNETEFSTFHANIDQGMGNSTGCGHFSKPPVTELAL